MDAYRELIRENIRYDDYVREHPYDTAQLDEMVELMVEAVRSKKKNIRVVGNDFPQAAVKSRLLKLDSEHVRFVFDCLRENTTQVRNMKQYLLTVLYNAPATMESYYAAQVCHNLCVKRMTMQTEYYMQKQQNILPCRLAQENYHFESSPVRSSPRKNSS